MDLDRTCRCLRAFALCILNRDCLKTYRDTRFLLSMSMVVEPALMCWLGCRGMACHGTAHDWVCVCVCDLQLLQHHNKISDNHHKTTQISELNHNNSNPNLKTKLSKQAPANNKQLPPNHTKITTKSLTITSVSQTANLQQNTPSH